MLLNYYYMTFSFVTTHFILLKVDDLYKYRDIMKQPAAILVVPVLYTILVLPVFYQNLPVSAILVQILVYTSIPVSSRIFQYLQY